MRQSGTLNVFAVRECASVAHSGVCTEREVVAIVNGMQPYGSLDNYIETLRNEAGLSQKEFALLVGLNGHTGISKWERDERRPDTIEYLIALELILDEPLQSIFAGIAERIRPIVAKRAAKVLEESTDKSSAWTADKLRALDRMAHLEENPQSWRNIA